MGRRIYIKKTSSKVKKKALDQFRKTRKQIEQQSPDLLDSIRDRLEDAQTQIDSPEDDFFEDKVAIDKTKNLKSVMQSLALRNSSKEFEKGLKDILMDVKSMES